MINRIVITYHGSRTVSIERDNVHVNGPLFPREFTFVSSILEQFRDHNKLDKNQVELKVPRSEEQSND